MQNSLERLLEGVAAVLRETVRPELQAGYAKVQIDAAAEILVNVAARASWRVDLIEARCERLTATLLEVAAALPASLVPTLHDDVVRVAESLPAHALPLLLERLAEVQDVLVAAVPQNSAAQRIIADYLAADLRDEDDLMSTGMFYAS